MEHTDKHLRCHNARVLGVAVAALAVIGAISMSVLTGCTSEDVSATDLSKESTSLTDTVDFKTTPSADDVATVNDFGFKIFKQVDDGTSNTCISPLSIEYALGMTANGAEGETLAQMESVLGGTLDDINQTLRAVRLVSEENADEAEETNKDAGDAAEETKEALHIANSVWIKDGFEVNKSFLDTNATYYDAGIFQAPFDETTVRDMNEWVKNNTGDMIDNIVNDLPADDVMFLVNALAFEGTWKTPYKSSSTSTGTFTTEDGEEQEVDFMSATEYTYLEGAGTTGFVKRYNEGSYAFVALLPDEGTSVDDVIANLDGKTIASLLDDAQETRVSTKMPRFESTYETGLIPALKNMGMTDAFDENRADFTGISTSNQLFISGISHKTYIKVDEEGTKAAAATTIDISPTSAEAPPEYTVYLDRPFIYMIIDEDTEAALFVGVVRDL